MKVLVTGSAGFLGRAVVANLAANGNQVIAGTRRPDRLADVQTVSLDVTDRDSVRRAVLGSACDAVVHLAGMTRMRESTRQPLAFYDVNTAGALQVMHALDELGRTRAEPPHIVFASTGAVYGSQPAIPQREDDPVNAENPYAASKLAAEELIRHHAKSGRSVATILRFSNIAGGVSNIYDDDGDHLIPRVLTALRDGAQITVNGDGQTTRDYIHVSDAAEAVRAALQARPGQDSVVLNLGSGTETAVRAIIEAAERAAGKTAQIERRPAGPEARRVVMSIDRATAYLDWKPVHLAVDRLVTDAWSASASPRS